VAPDEVQVALTNEGLLAERLQGQEKALSDYTEAVRIGTVKYVAGAMDMLSLLQLEERQIESQAAVIQLRDALLANRITPHLALGGSFDTAPAAAPRGAMTSGVP
jgi:outer membrane protein, multidrug efflux system